MFDVNNEEQPKCDGPNTKRQKLSNDYNINDFQIADTLLYNKLKLKPQPERYTYLFAALAEIVDFAR
jgi:hypothetical protein